jgi:hypothetical protein
MIHHLEGTSYFMKLSNAPQGDQSTERAVVAVPAVVPSAHRGLPNGSPSAESLEIAHTSAALTSNNRRGGSQETSTLGEADVFLNHLNAIALRATTLPTQASHLASAPASSAYLRERIRAVRRENRDLRGDIGTISKENQNLRGELGRHRLDKVKLEERVGAISKENESLREELSRHLLDKQRLEEQLRQTYEMLSRCEEKRQAADRCIQEIMASLNWRVAHRFHCLRRSFKRRFGTSRSLRERSPKDRTK